MSEIIIDIIALILTYIKPFTEDFPRADIHELISPDLLHQVIKGAFKDHLVTWVQKWIEKTNDKKTYKQILDDIDRRLVVLSVYSFNILILI